MVEPDPERPSDVVAGPDIDRPFERGDMLRRLDDRQFDVLVVGGGITGCGVALDAATRGLSVALVERDDFASGTSSKSSRLVHGGLRYLQQGDVALVKEALRERHRLLRNAPHLVTPLPFLIPVLTKDGPVSTRIAKALRSALWMYDVSGGWRIGRRHRRLDAAEALTHCPTLPADRLSSGFVYHDAEADDARLTLALARTAAEFGAVVANRCEVVGLSVGPEGVLDGATVVDRCDGSEHRVRARCVVSATGVWIDRVRALGPDAAPVSTARTTGSVRPAKGVHVTIPWDLVRNDIAVVIAVPKDRRSLFLVPWGPQQDGTFTHCYVGTTDTEHRGDLDDPQTDADDLDYVLRALNHSITPPVGRPIRTEDVTAVWSGLRPLVSDTTSERTADLSRRHRIEVSDAGLVSVTGGKLTTYRQMAEDTVDVVMRRLGEPVSRRRGRSRTARIELVGARGMSRHRSTPPDHLTSRYGDRARSVRRLVEDDPSLGEPLVTGLPYLRAEAVYAVRHEMATTLDDLLVRRTRAHSIDRAACRGAAPHVAELMGRELAWSPEELARQVEHYRSICDTEERAAQYAAADAPDLDAPTRGADS